MKNVLLILLTTGMLISGPVFAFNDPPGYDVKNSFQQHYPGIEDVKWTALDDKNIYQAIFTYENNSVAAYFAQNGDLLISTRVVDLKSLPASVQMKFNTRYKSYMLVNVYEGISGEEISYYFILRNEIKQLTVKITPSGNSSVVLKQNLR